MAGAYALAGALRLTRGEGGTSEILVRAVQEEITQTMTFPAFRQVVLDSLDVRRDAEFYRQLLGLSYAGGSEPPADPSADDADWLVLTTSDGVRLLAFQLVESLPAPTWPEPGVPQQLHLDFRVRSVDELRAHHDRAIELGGRLLQDRIDDPDEPLRVYADPSGHPFCLFVLA